MRCRRMSVIETVSSVVPLYQRIASAYSAWSCPGSRTSEQQHQRQPGEEPPDVCPESDAPTRAREEGCLGARDMAIPTPNKKNVEGSMAASLSAPM